ncbi:MAG: hypothetical protein ACJA1B_000283 [Polaribacter sp.]|jgi:hypothetical protein
MRHSFFLILMLLLLNCTTAELVDSWKNPAIESYAPYKVLVVGMTPNTEARLKFEQQLKNEFEFRGINAMMSLELFDPSLRTEKMTQEELKEFENKLANDGFDTVLFTKTIGVEDKVAYKKSYYNYDETYRRFKDDYLMYQDIYYNPEYYDEYTVYHAETSLYCICPTKDRALIWKGYIDIIDPQSIEETVNDYVNLVLLVLEKEMLINQKLLKEELTEM